MAIGGSAIYVEALYSEFYKKLWLFVGHAVEQKLFKLVRDTV